MTAEQAGAVWRNTGQLLPPTVSRGGDKQSGLGRGLGPGAPDLSPQPLQYF